MLIAWPSWLEPEGERVVLAARPLRDSSPAAPVPPAPPPARQAPPARPAPATAGSPRLRELRFSLDAPERVAFGGTFAVTVNAAVPDGASAFSFTVRHDPALLAFVGAADGDLMTHQNAIARTSAYAGPAPGTVTVNVEQEEGPPVAGAGSLAVLLFRPQVRTQAPMRIALSDIAVTVGDGSSVPVTAPPDTTLTIDP
jgi:hypothetical protein